MPESDATFFLGTRVAPPTREAPLPPQFTELLQRFHELETLYHAGEITKEQFAAQLAVLRATDDEGFEWTLGASTHSWYRRSVDGTWIGAPAPQAALPLEA